MPRKNIGRVVINWRKDFYRNGGSTAAAVEIRDAVVAAGLYPRCTMALAQAWDFQARLELSREDVYVTQPRAAIKHLRTANASPQEREFAQRSAQQELALRAAHQRDFQKAAAAQIDATPNEYRKAAQLEIAASILADVAQTS